MNTNDGAIQNFLPECRAEHLSGGGVRRVGHDCGEYDGDDHVQFHQPFFGGVSP